jgi:ABC-type phosphate/phosphonate transport system substrate-binding protein
MIASLAMYDFGPLRPANDRLWALIRSGLRQRGIAAPDILTREEGAYWPAWHSPELLLSQTCGYPFRARLHGKVTYVGTPDYGVEGCPPGHYRSVFIAHADDPRETLADFDGAQFAFNDGLSQSGWAAPQTHAARLGLRLIPTLQTGAHRASAGAVAESRADIASLDAVTFALLQATDPLTARLKIVGRTDPSPGLPCITALGRDPDPIFDAVGQAVAALSAQDRATLRLAGFVRIPEADYLAVPNPPSPEQIAATF